VAWLRNLPAITRGGDPRRPVDVDADVALVGDERLAGMDAHPDADRAVVERPLGRGRGRERIGRAVEGHEEGVTLGVYLDAAVALEGLTQEPSVLGQRLRVGVAELVQQTRRPFDVGEEKGDGAGREFAHHVKDRAARRLCQVP
jgi:hypothetical protein